MTLFSQKNVFYLVTCNTFLIKLFIIYFLKKINKNNIFGGTHTLLPKIWENNAILDWSATTDYSIGSIVKLVGGGELYRALAPSGPNQSSGAINPSTDDGTYWINESDVVHKTVTEHITGRKYFDEGALIASRSNQSNLILANTSYTKGSANPSSDITVGVLRCGYVGGINEDYDFTHITTSIDTAGATNLGLYVYKNTVSKSSSGVRLQYPLSENVVFYPTQANTDLGKNLASNRWNQIYAANTTISTSDERLKSSISNIPDMVLDAWENIGFVQFQFNDAVEKKGDSARLHSGLIAQNIRDAFAAKGVDATSYGLFCHDVWEAKPESVDEEGNIVEPAQPAGDMYSLRYEEALCMEAAYQRRENRRLKDRVSELENKVLQLEDKLNQLLDK